MLASFAFEAQTKGVFERLPKAGQSREISPLYPKSRVAGIRSENAGNVLRSGQGRIMKQNTFQVLQHSLAVLACRLARMRGQPPEILVGIGKSEGFQNARLSTRAFADEGEATKVGDEHHAVSFPVFLDLLSFRYLSHILRRRFGFDNAARGILNQERIVSGVRITCLAAKLIGREQTPIRQPRAPVSQINDTADFGRKGLP